MLNKLGNFIVKDRWWVILVWVVLAIVITIFSPKLSSVTSSDQTSFLPDKYESVAAGKIADKASASGGIDFAPLIQFRRQIQRQALARGNAGHLAARFRRCLAIFAHEQNRARIDVFGQPFEHGRKDARPFGVALRAPIGLRRLAYHPREEYP